MASDLPSNSLPSLSWMATIPARPPVSGTSTPKTVASSTCGSVDTAASTSVVATFSPFQRKVSPSRSVNAACPSPWARIRSPVLNHTSPSLKASRTSFFSDSFLSV